MFYFHRDSPTQKRRKTPQTLPSSTNATNAFVNNSQRKDAGVVSVAEGNTNPTGACQSPCREIMTNELAAALLEGN
ncbi:hypothetical protein ZHAS_00015275 [Anopheles sinensis]|uniref:Uncharacterized protein n=1 Tax=Anopheles sinensis TaxID=74873 RepID=A0A084WAK7_ANOSI|nr:hypothetical protein ZHAS_00015275 [Anopheles sinensis]